MSKFLTALLLIVGLINFVPVFAVLSGERLAAAYQLTLIDSNLEILLRHRALLFGIVGGFVIYAAFIPQYQTAAMIMAAVSMLGYVYLMWSVGGYNEALYKVAIVDVVGVVFLALAILVKLLQPEGELA